MPNIQWGRDFRKMVTVGLGISRINQKAVACPDPPHGFKKLACAILVFFAMATAPVYLSGEGAEEKRRTAAIDGLGRSASIAVLTRHGDFFAKMARRISGEAPFAPPSAQTGSRIPRSEADETWHRICNPIPPGSGIPVP